MEAVAVFPVALVGVEAFGGEIEFLMRCVEEPVVCVVDGDGVELDNTSGGLEALAVDLLEFDDGGVEFARVIVGVGDGGDGVGVDGVVVVAAEGFGDFDEVGVGPDIEKGIHDGHVLIVGVEIHVGRAGRGEAEKK